MRAMSPLDIRQARESMGFSQEDFAELFEVDVREIANWETGFSPIPKTVNSRLLDMTARIAESREITQQLATRGISPCTWQPDLGLEPRALARLIDAHEKTCPSCQARRSLEKKRRGFMPKDRGPGGVASGSWLRNWPFATWPTLLFSWVLAGLMARVAWGLGHLYEASWPITFAIAFLLAPAAFALIFTLAAIRRMLYGE